MNDLHPCTTHVIDIGSTKTQEMVLDGMIFTLNIEEGHWDFKMELTNEEVDVNWFIQPTGVSHNGYKINLDKLHPLDTHIMVSPVNKVCSFRRIQASGDIYGPCTGTGFMVFVGNISKCWEAFSYIKICSSLINVINKRKTQTFKELNALIDQLEFEIKSESRSPDWADAPFNTTHYYNENWYMKTDYDVYPYDKLNKCWVEDSPIYSIDTSLYKFLIGYHEFLDINWPPNVKDIINVHVDEVNESKECEVIVVHGDSAIVKIIGTETHVAIDGSNYKERVKPTKNVVISENRYKELDKEINKYFTGDIGLIREMLMKVAGDPNQIVDRLSK